MSQPGTRLPAGTAVVADAAGTDLPVPAASDAPSGFVFEPGATYPNGSHWSWNKCNDWPTLVAKLTAAEPGVGAVNPMRVWFDRTAVIPAGAYALPTQRQEWLGLGLPTSLTFAVNATVVPATTMMFDDVSLANGASGTDNVTFGAGQYEIHLTGQTTAVSGGVPLFKTAAGTALFVELHDFASLNGSSGLVIDSATRAFMVVILDGLSRLTVSAVNPANIDAVVAASASAFIDPSYYPKLLIACGTFNDSSGGTGPTTIPPGTVAGLSSNIGALISSGPGGGAANNLYMSDGTTWNLVQQTSIPFVYEPGGTTQKNVYAIASELSHAVASDVGTIEIQVDTVHATNLDSDFTFGDGNILTGIPNSAPASLATNNHAMSTPGRVANLILQCTGATTPITVGNSFVMVLDEGAEIQGDVNPLIALSASDAATIECRNASNVGDSTNVAVELDTGASLTLLLGEECTLQLHGIHGDGTATVDVGVQSPSAAVDPAYFTDAQFSISFDSGVVAASPIFGPGSAVNGWSIGTNLAMFIAMISNSPPATTFQFDFSNAGDAVSNVFTWCQAGTILAGIINQANGVVPSFTPTAAAASPCREIRDVVFALTSQSAFSSVPKILTLSGKAHVTANGTGGVLFAISGGTTTFTMTDDAVLGDGTHAVIPMTGGTINLYLHGNANLQASAITLAGGAALTIFRDPSATIDATYVGMGGVTIVNTALGANVQYVPTNPGDWATTEPITVQEAIDRIAAVVSSNGADPIP